MCLAATLGLRATRSAGSCVDMRCSHHGACCDALPAAGGIADTGNLDRCLTRAQQLATAGISSWGSLHGLSGSHSPKPAWLDIRMQAPHVC